MFLQNNFYGVYIYQSWAKYFKYQVLKIQSFEKYFKYQV